MEKYKALKNWVNNIYLVSLEFMWKNSNMIDKNLKEAIWGNHHHHLVQETKVAASLWEWGKDILQENQSRM